MKLQPQDMQVFELDYGDLVRPPFAIRRETGWSQCTNESGELLVIYGPKHNSDRSIFDCSPYLLPAGQITPDRWDCKGYLLPADRQLYRRWRELKHGPLAIKFWDHRRFCVKSLGSGVYQSSLPNGIYEPSTINWAIPNFTYVEIITRINRQTEAER